LSLCLTDQALRYEGVWRSERTDPNILDFSTSWRWVVGFTLRPFYPRGKSLKCPLDRKPDGPQNHSQQKILIMSNHSWWYNNVPKRTNQTKVIPYDKHFRYHAHCQWEKTWSGEKGKMFSLCAHTCLIITWNVTVPLFCSSLCNIKHKNLYRKYHIKRVWMDKETLLKSILKKQCFGRISIVCTSCLYKCIFISCSNMQLCYFCMIPNTGVHDVNFIP
jgi:hypothetical protein